MFSEVVFLKMPSRNRKKRAKQRTVYLQKRDDVWGNKLSEENKAQRRTHYEANPEKNKATEHESYHADIARI